MPRLCTAGSASRARLRCCRRCCAKDQRFAVEWFVNDRQPIAGERLTVNDPTQIRGEVGEPCEASRLAIQMPEIEAPALRLPTGVFAHQAVKPTLDAAGEAEVAGVDREHARGIDNAGVEPVREDELKPERATAQIGAFSPFVDPREAMQAPERGLADRCNYAGRLQAVERRLEPFV